MKRKIVSVILIGIVLLFFMIFMTMKDAIWFESMMVDKMLAEQYPNNKPGLGKRLIAYDRLFKKGEEAAKQFDWANTVWNSTDSEPEDYYKAANIIVTNLEINKEEWLTLGNIIKYFGIPRNIEGLFPRIDDDGNLLVIPYEFDVYYEDKKIRFNFSLSGFVESVMLVNNDGNMETGKSILYWPHDYTYAKHFPICAGFEYNKKATKYILNKTRKGIKEAIGKGAFFHNLEVITPQEKDLIDIKNMKIYLVDGINKDLARVYFHFSDGDMTVYYRPWLLVSDWKSQDDLTVDVTETKNEKSKGEIITSKNKRIRELFQRQ